MKTFFPNQEYFQKSPIQLQNDQGDWCNVTALITKLANTRKLAFDADVNIECADEHLIRTNNLDCTFAKDIGIGDKIELINNSLHVSVMKKLRTMKLYMICKLIQNHIYMRLLME
jgi:hypothetical protein